MLVPVPPPSTVTDAVVTSDTPVTSPTVPTSDQTSTATNACPPAPPCDCTCATRETTSAFMYETSSSIRVSTYSPVSAGSGQPTVEVSSAATATTGKKSLLEAAKEVKVEPMTFDHLPDPAKEPVAIGIGVTGLVVVTSFLGLIFILDLASLKKDVAVMGKNLRSFCRKSKVKQQAWIQ